MARNSLMALYFVRILLCLGFLPVCQGHCLPAESYIFSVQENSLGLPSVACNGIVVCHEVAHVCCEGMTNACAFLVDGVLGGVCHIFYAFLHGFRGAVVHQFVVYLRKSFAVVGPLPVGEVYIPNAIIFFHESQIVDVMLAAFALSLFVCIGVSICKDANFFSLHR